MSLEILVSLHLKPFETLSERRLITKCAAFFLKEVPAYLDTESGETFYDIPYSRITEIIFQNDTTVLNKSELDDLKGTIEARIRENLNKQGIPHDIKEILAKSKKSEDESIEDNCVKHLLACYRKFVSHIGLAEIQKIFILDNVNFANQQVHELNKQLQEANQTIEKMVNEVNSAARLATTGNLDAQVALKQALVLDNNVKKSDLLVKQALDEAKKIKSETSDLTIQFITILGIFATIIITVFGGISVVKAATELLASGKTSIILVSFTIGVLMCSLISLVILLTSWINSVQNKEYNKLDEIRWGVLTVYFFITLFLGIYILTSDKF